MSARFIGQNNLRTTPDPRQIGGPIDDINMVIVTTRELVVTETATMVDMTVTGLSTLTNLTVTTGLSLPAGSITNAMLAAG